MPQCKNSLNDIGFFLILHRFLKTRVILNHLKRYLCFELGFYVHRVHTPQTCHLLPIRKRVKKTVNSTTKTKTKYNMNWNNIYIIR